MVCAAPQLNSDELALVLLLGGENLREERKHRPNGGLLESFLGGPDKPHLFSVISDFNALNKLTKVANSCFYSVALNAINL